LSCKVVLSLECRRIPGVGTAMNNLVGLIADTHDNRDKSARAVELFNRKDVGIVLHAGDIIAPFNVREFALLKARFVAVFGNNDGERIGLRDKFAQVGQIANSPHEVEHAGKRFVLMHEPGLLEPVAASGHYDMIVYGHTHRVDVRSGKTLIVNPGECGGWLNGRCTVAIVDIESMAAEVIDL